jgi:hypothetical protein
MSIRANRWIEEVAELLRERAMISTDIAEHLKATGKGGRYPPSPRRVTFVCRSDKRFRELGEEVVGTIARNRSHPVKLIGRADTRYEILAPYRALE